jgi:integrase
MSRFVTVAPGIRKKPNGTFLATKSINGKRHYKTTTSLLKAKQWKERFLPFVNPTAKPELNPAATSKMNGRDLTNTFGDVWKKYQQKHLSTKAEETQYRVTLRVSKFTQSLTNVRMCEINSDTIDAVIRERMAIVESSLRCNFHEEIKKLGHIFKWYKKTCDPYFKSPIEEHHKLISVIKPVPELNRHIKPHEVQKFIRQLSGVWQKLAYMQFYMGGRIQEAAGLVPESIYWEQGKIRVETVMTWPNGRPRLKHETKTKTISYVYINAHMVEILDDLLENRPADCPTLFHVNGKPLRYSWIIKAYNDALKDADLEYKGTHILRYGLAGYAGEKFGDEGSRAGTRHRTMAMARKYRGKVRVMELTEENKQVVIHAQSLFRAPSRDQEDVSLCN